MCTVTAARGNDGSALRILINRDERRLRMAARPPAMFEPGGVAAAWPVDQQGGGTWTAITEHGLAFALLNVSSPRPAAIGQASRGLIIPSLADTRDIDEAIDRFASGPARWACAPFKLLITSIDRSVMLTRDGVADVVLPWVQATSSLGDDLVAAPRRALFDRLLASSDDPWQAQDRLHSHAWPDRRHVSALMSRTDACTVSRTEIIMGRDGSEMRYVALHDGWPCGVAVPSIRLARIRAAAAA